jgi:hypothetical protein
LLTCLLYRLLCGFVRLLARRGGERELEIVVLCHQLAILRRSGRRPQYTTADRALLAAASRLLPPERWSCFAVCPQTLRRWHRTLLQGGRRRRGRRPGRPPLAAETRGLIKRMGRENPRWGYMRIEGELLKLGISVSATTVASVLRASGLGPAPRRIGPSWPEFLRAQAHSMLGEGRRAAIRDNGLEGDAGKPSAPAQDREPREVEADDNLSLADAVEPRVGSHPLPERSCSALPRVLPPARGPLRLRPSHRSHARDGPQAQAGARLTTKCSGATSKPSRLAPRPDQSPAQIREGASQDLPPRPEASTQQTDHHPKRPA